MARRGSRGFTLDATALIQNIDRLEPRVDAAFGALLERQGDLAAAHMRTHAPWTDRTGNARSGLGSVVFRQSGRWVLNLYGRANYQIWLEVKNSGRYAIITPTLIDWGPRIMRSTTGLIDRLRAGGRI